MEHYGRKRDRGFACSSWPGPCHWQAPVCTYGFVKFVKSSQRCELFLYKCLRWLKSAAASGTRGALPAPHALSTRSRARASISSRSPRRLYPASRRTNKTSSHASGPRRFENAGEEAALWPQVRARADGRRSGDPVGRSTPHRDGPLTQTELEGRWRRWRSLLCGAARPHLRVSAGAAFYARASRTTTSSATTRAALSRPAAPLSASRWI